MELEGKVAFLTGGSTGIGRAAAELFAREGADVYFTDLNEEGGAAAEAEIRALGFSATFIASDVSDEAKIKATIEQVKKTAGRIDCAANFAAVSIKGVREPTGNVDVDIYDKIMDVDLRGQFLSVKHEINAMLETGGSIVNVSSGAGVVGTRLNPSYVAAKHGVIGLTKAAALDYADKGIRVNTLVPGVTLTPMIAETPPDYMAKIEAGIPTNRIAQPIEIAQGALWLCSDRSSYATGSTLVIDGGYTAQ